MLGQDGVEHAFRLIRNDMTAHQFTDLIGHAGAGFNGRSHAAPVATDDCGHQVLLRAVKQKLGAVGTIFTFSIMLSVDLL